MNDHMIYRQEHSTISVIYSRSKVPGFFKLNSLPQSNKEALDFFFWFVIIFRNPVNAEEVGGYVHSSNTPLALIFIVL